MNLADGVEVTPDMLRVIYALGASTPFPDVTQRRLQTGGGGFVAPVYNGVELIYLPTMTVFASEEERSEHANHANAWKRLKRELQFSKLPDLVPADKHPAMRPRMREIHGGWWRCACPRWHGIGMSMAEAYAEWERKRRAC